MKKFKRVINILIIAAIVALTCFAPFTSVCAEGDFLAFNNIVIKGQQIKVGVSAPAGVLPADAIFASEALVHFPLSSKGYEHIEYSLFDSDGNRIATFDSGYQVKLYLQIPEGLTAAEAQELIVTPSKSVQQDGVIEIIDGIEYLTVVVTAMDVTSLEEFAKDEVASYKNPADYRDAEKAQIEAILAEANADIEAVTATEDEGDGDALGVIIAEAKAKLDALKTDAQYKEEEAAALADAKANAKEEIASYKNPADYSNAQKAVLNNAIAEANAAIDAAATEAEVAEALAAAKTAIDAIEMHPEEPDTGEHSGVYLWVALMAAALAATAVLVIRRRTN